MARSFNGTTDLINVGNVSALDITGTALTILVTFKVANTAAVKHLAGKWTATPTGYVMSVQGGLNNNILSVWIVNAGVWEYVNTGTVLSADTWYRGAMLKNGTGAGALKKYLNGVEDGSVTSNNSIPSTAANFKIGNSDENKPYEGTIAEVGVYNVALTVAEIEAHANGIPVSEIRPSSRRGHWALFGTIDPESDWSGNNNHGTLTGTTRVDHSPKISLFGTNFMREVL